MSKMKFLPLMLGCLSLTFCGNPTEKKEDTEVAAVETVAEPAVKSAGLTFVNAEGNKVSLSELKGKAVFINFWATWCPPCINEMPSIDDLKKHFKANDDLVFLMVDIEGEVDASTAFMKENGYDLPVYISEGEITSEYLGNAIPTTVLINKNGEIVNCLEGSRDYYSKEMIQTIQDLIDNKN